MGGMQRNSEDYIAGGLYRGRFVGLINQDTAPATPRLINRVSNTLSRVLR